MVAGHMGPSFDQERALRAVEWEVALMPDGSLGYDPYSGAKDSNLLALCVSKCKIIFKRSAPLAKHVRRVFFILAELNRKDSSLGLLIH